MLLLAFAVTQLIARAHAQNVAINNDGSLPDPNAIPDIKSANKGILIPRTSSATRQAMPATKGLLVYDTTTNSFWFNNGTAWRALYSNGIGSNNTAIGAGADVGGYTLSNATALGAGAIANTSNKVRIGNSAVTVIEGQVPFTTPSDGRYKFNVKDDVPGLDFITQLRPVTYQFDVKRFDTQQAQVSVNNNIQWATYNEATMMRRSGFIAQEVEKATIATGYNFSGLIKPKNAQEHYGLSYESFVVPLVKAMQELNNKVIELQHELNALKQSQSVLK